MFSIERRGQARASSVEGTQLGDFIAIEQGKTVTILEFPIDRPGVIKRTHLEAETAPRILDLAERTCDISAEIYKRAAQTALITSAVLVGNGILRKDRNSLSNALVSAVFALGLHRMEKGMEKSALRTGIIKGLVEDLE